MTALLVKDACEYQKYHGIQDPNVRESITEERARESL